MLQSVNGALTQLIRLRHLLDLKKSAVHRGKILDDLLVLMAGAAAL